MFDADANWVLFQPVIATEILEVLKCFKGDKSPGPDGWTMELFTHFFDLFQQDLVYMVEKSQVLGYIHPHLNSTYIALILKKPNSHTFLDFHLISLCNLVYKIISKTIANWITHSLSMSISPQQFGFLKNR